MLHASYTLTAARLAAAVAVGVLSGCGGGVGSPGASGTGVADAVACSAGTVERRPLILPDGLHAYVEPSNVFRVDGDIVIVGSPTYTWELGGPTARMASDSEHIAVYLDDDEPRLVEKPVDVDVHDAGVRSTALGDGRWAVLFGEAHPDTTRFMSVARVFYAEYDGTRWSTVEEVPLPPGHDVAVGTSSELVALEDSVAWAVLDRAMLAAHFYERVDGGWRWSTVPDSDVEAVRLAAGPSGLWLAMSGLDPAITEPRKSVRLYHREAGGWRLVSRDPATETYLDVAPPHVMVLPGGVTVTWGEQRGEGVHFARVGVRVDAPGTLVQVDDHAPVIRPFATQSGDPSWMVWHSDVVAREAELRFLHLDGDRTHIAQSMPLPYTGFFAALADGPETVLVTGAEFSPDPARPTVRSLTLRLNPSCS